MEQRFQQYSNQMYVTTSFLSVTNNSFRLLTNNQNLQHATKVEKKTQCKDSFCRNLQDWICNAKNISQLPLSQKVFFLLPRLFKFLLEQFEFTQSQQYIINVPLLLLSLIHDINYVSSNIFPYNFCNYMFQVFCNINFLFCKQINNSKIHKFITTKTFFGQISHAAMISGDHILTRCRHYICMHVLTKMVRVDILVI
eukprot:TRINITY_DN1552_c3_g1_i2.p1 TRINITY_DN1552_c3_g1~~TRINITY_DN1552_c3_g1_i2.p1  ORF type:complete len:197 (-),score=-14.70 TRINITY_DN1552_c3_g1_i2:435-1025(-)